MSERRKLRERLWARALLLIVLSLAFGGAVNAVSPRGVPWYFPWSRRVELRASEENIPLVDLTFTQQSVATGEQIVLDARALKDFSAGHLPGALSFPFAKADEALTEWQVHLAKTQPLLVYCANAHCDDGLMLCLYLRQRGYTKVRLFLDGFKRWREAGLEIERSE